MCMHVYLIPRSSLLASFFSSCFYQNQNAFEFGQVHKFRIKKLTYETSFFKLTLNSLNTVMNERGIQIFIKIIRIEKKILSIIYNRDLNFYCKSDNTNTLFLIIPLNKYERSKIYFKAICNYFLIFH